VGQKKVSCYTLVDNFGKYGPISIILSLLQSVRNCGIRCYKISHISLDLLLHYLAKVKCSKIHLYSSYSI